VARSPIIPAASREARRGGDPLADIERASTAPTTAAANGGFDRSRIQAVAFDGYGTLLQFHDAEFRVHIAEILRQQRLEAPDGEEVFRTWFGCYSKVGPWAHLFPKDFKPGESERINREPMVNGPLPEFITQWEWWRRQWVETFRVHSLEGDPDGAATYLREQLSHLLAYPDALETVDRLAAGGMRLGLLSNADEDFLQSAVSRNRLRFSVIQSSESLRTYKPHRATFMALAERLGCEPEEILYVGDSPYADVHGAHGAGLRTAWVRRSERPYPEDMPAPDIEVRSLAEVAEVLLEGA
jgi:2-haloalkanoic acid dehalogenase type II